MNDDDFETNDKNDNTDPAQRQRQGRGEQEQHQDRNDTSRAIVPYVAIEGEDARRAGGDTAGGGESEPLAKRIVREFLRERQIVVLFDGSLQQVTRTGSDLYSILSSSDIDLQWLEDEFILDARTQLEGITPGIAKRAIRQVIRQEQSKRQARIGRPLFSRLCRAERLRATPEWEKLGRLFDMPQELAVAIPQHFIFQVKTKLRKELVRHHLMPIVTNAVQGSGKTTFVKLLLAPLKELATGPVLISDFADARSIDIYRYPAVFIDDMEELPPTKIAILKSTLTSETGRRRRLGSSSTDGFRQRATLIGTANRDIGELVADHTGNRRFVSLPFRNGEVKKGGDPEVRRIVNGLDYELLWRSVDADGPVPIEPHLEALFAHQAKSLPKSDLYRWLIELDTESDEVRSLNSRGAIGARDFHQLFCRQTGSNMTMQDFGRQMNLYAADPRVPFGPKRHTNERNVYPIRPRKSAS